MADISSCSDDDSEADDSAVVEDVLEVEEEQSTSEATRKIRKYKSQVWRFFKKKNAKSVTCTLCKKTLAYHGGTTSMLQHLSRKHPAENVVKSSDGRKQTNLDVFTRKRTIGEKH